VASRYHSTKIAPDTSQKPPRTVSEILHHSCRTVECITSKAFLSFVVVGAVLLVIMDMQFCTLMVADVRSCVM